MSCRPLSVVLAIAYLLVVVAGDHVKLPSSVKTCKRGTDDYSSCLRLAIQESWPAFVNGIPEIDLEPLDPLYVKFEQEEFHNGELHGKLEQSNVYVYGLKNARFLAVRPEYSDGRQTLEIDWVMPKCFAEGEYTADGSLGQFKLGGKGHFNISAEDMKITWAISGTVKDDTWVIEHFIPTLQIGKLKIWCDDLFHGNAEMTKSALAFANEFWPMIYRGMYPYLRDVWDKICTDYANQIFSKLSFNEVFP